eukprot:TRINITY_DN103278_c0_g1_i1.p1 TRINITY_DN103278_c0_g1~~TRINITY_DN103278_c0_g1_i1.p1  ORF type:complete len:348 (+),score=62.99 TRINITY_DN103278_c0_g1_i1:99-1142(+)
MADDNPNDLRSYVGQTLWRRRIIKETAALSPVRRENFSLRSCLKTADVPMRFKPGQIDPHHKEPVSGLDEDTERMLRADIATRQAVPAEQLLWPETSQQQVGWLASPPKPGLPWEERGTLAGLSPRVGLGWTSSRDEAVTVPPMPMSARLPKSKKDVLVDKWIGLKRGSAREEVTPHKADVRLSRKEQSRLRAEAKRQEAQRLQGLLEDWEASKPERRERRLQRLRARASSQDDQRLSEMPAESSSPSKMELPHFVSPAASAGLRNRIPVAVEDSWGLQDGGSVIPRPTSQDQNAVADAGSRVRGFYGPERPWNKPKGQSDVVTFGDAYARSWGVGLFSKQAKKGSD